MLGKRIVVDQMPALFLDLIFFLSPSAQAVDVDISGSVQRHLHKDLRGTMQWDALC